MKKLSWAVQHGFFAFYMWMKETILMQNYSKYSSVILLMNIQKCLKWECICFVYKAMMVAKNFYF